MEVTAIHQVLSDVLQDKLSLVDEISLQYITDVLVDVKVLPIKTLVGSLATLFASAGIVENDKEATTLLKDISMRLCADPHPHGDEKDEGSDHEEPLVRKVSRPFIPTRQVTDSCILTVEGVITQTYSEDPKVRKATLRDMCPCHVKGNIDALWQRIMEMRNDPDANVRYQVMHNLCDGSPLCREADVIRTLDDMHNDPDKKVRRRVHQVLTHYRKTGKWNIL